MPRELPLANRPKTSPSRLRPIAARNCRAGAGPPLLVEGTALVRVDQAAFHLLDRLAQGGNRVCYRAAGRPKSAREIANQVVIEHRHRKCYVSM